MGSTDSRSDPEGALLDPAARKAPPERAGARQLAINVIAGGSGNIIKVVVQLVMLPVMARLLGPAEFGIYGLALPTVAFFTILADAGMSVSLARERTQSSVVWSTAFWLMAGVGILLASIVTGWGFVVAEMSGEPKIRTIMATLSLSLLFLTASMLPSARITQQGRLFILSAADVTATLIGSVVAVILALQGAGAMSLAAQYVSTFFIRAVILNACAFVRPTFEFKLSQIRHHISMGTSIIASRLADFSGRLIENLIYGRAFGVAALGTFTFANQVPRFLGEAASNPIWAALYAHSLREEGAGVAAVHLKLTYILSLLLAPIAFILPPAVPILVASLLGPKWQEASVLLQILIPFYILNVVSAQSGAILLARGFGWTLFWITFVLLVGRIGAVYVGGSLSPVVVVTGIGLVHIVFSGLMIAVPARHRMVAAAPLLSSLAKTSGSAAVAGIGCGLLLGLLPPTLVCAALAMAGGFALYCLLLLALDGRRVMNEGLALVRLLTRRG
ncbi:oligosaccharide flippase family protein [Methylobacterium sp. J-076]|uniref:oligosaccharide flippase family protein n=1 Tax=Methylobacterium sp. J-076 TaxID=2836655 RepID=UPI001FBA5CED|nr:oligosaccharide flippase family protein [Methylobacterium sp. J-076]MCJ2012612.1 oligosaccharide flippase family protein [Methylobacterium sp. J-076]